MTDCFRDRAVSMEMKVASIQCTSLHCPWQGRSVEYEVSNPGIRKGGEEGSSWPFVPSHEEIFRDMSHSYRERVFLEHLVLEVTTAHSRV